MLRSLSTLSLVTVLASTLSGATQPSVADLVLHLPFDESGGTTAADVSGGGHHGSLVSGVTFDVDGGHVFGAAVFDGTGAGIDVPDHVDLNTGTYPQRTISLWYRASDTATRQVLFESGGGTRGFNIYLDAGTLHVGAWNDSSSESDWPGTFLATPAPSDGAWHHVALTLAGDTAVGPDARKMYHGGHLNKNNATGYWQNDPQNNHRWHRNAGLALCVLAAYSGAEGEHWILAKTKQELDYVARWLPDDGTSHEGPTYMVFGGSHLLIAMHAADRCFDADYLQQPFFKRVGPYLSQSLAPDRSALFAYGDSGGGLGAYANFLYKTAAVHRQADVQALLDGKWQQSPRSFDVSAWMALIWRDPALKPVGLGDVPTRSFFDDIGLAYIRDGWDDESVAAMFKCGPFGGYRLNAFRNSHDMRYINVAHDDPDANSLVLWKSGSYLAETDRYSKHKQSANHNTVLVNGMGQMARGRPEGGVWSQPGGDMTTMGVVTAWKPGKDVVIIEGEAAGSYLAYTDRKTKRTRPALQRFRRTFIWVEGRYVLVLDDIRAPSAVEVSWLIQGPKLSVQDKNALRFTLAHADATCPFQVAADHDRVAQKVVTSSADHRGKALGWQQLQLTVEARTVRFASA